MSEEEQKGLRLVPAWWPIVTAIVAAIFAAGGASAANSDANARQDASITSIEARLSRMEVIDRRLSRIEGKLGIESDLR